jgi:hypothetical protein
MIAGILPEAFQTLCDQKCLEKYEEVPKIR